MVQTIDISNPEGGCMGAPSGAGTASLSGPAEYPISPRFFSGIRIAPSLA